MRGAPSRPLGAAGVVVWRPPGGSVAAALRRDDGTGRNDATRLGAGSVELKSSGPTLVARFAAEHILGPDLLRTRCPGPSLAELAPGRALATGSVPLRALRHRRVVIHLRRGMRFDRGAYMGSSRADLTIVLRRRRVTTDTYDVPAPLVAPRE